ncbi:MAG: hypothetical protein ACHQWU_05485 [Gemmatimonadales bacterium]
MNAKPLTRGVYIAPWLGPDGETILVAIDSKRRLIAEPTVVAAGASQVLAGDALWDRLEAADPGRVADTRPHLTLV